jgi:hypothetical protein
MVKPLMSWVSSQKRWTKWYKGVTYSVSCKQLTTPPTKEGSVKAANDWWTAKQDELDKPPKPPGYDLAMERHQLLPVRERGLKQTGSVS